MGVSASRPDRFISKEIPPGTGRMGNLGPRADMGAQKKILPHVRIKPRFLGSPARTSPH